MFLAPHIEDAHASNSMQTWLNNMALFDKETWIFVQCIYLKEEAGHLCSQHKSNAGTHCFCSATHGSLEKY